MGTAQRRTYVLAMMFLQITCHSYWALGIQMTVTRHPGNSLALIASFQGDVVDAFVFLGITQLTTATL